MTLKNFNKNSVYVMDFFFHLKNKETTVERLKEIRRNYFVRFMCVICIIILLRKISRFCDIKRKIKRFIWRHIFPSFLSLNYTMSHSNKNVREEMSHIMKSVRIYSSWRILPRR